MAFSRRARYAAVAVGMLMAWIVVRVVGDQDVGWALLVSLSRAIDRLFGEAVARGAVAFVLRSAQLIVYALIGASVVAPLGLFARASARARQLATGKDVLERLRARLAAPTPWLRALTWAPAALGVALTTFDPLTARWSAGWLALGALTALPAAFGLTWLVRRYLTALAAPPALAEDLAQVVAGEDEIFFNAVAATPEARGAVAGFGVATVGVAAAIAGTPLPALVANGGPYLLAYAALVAAAAVGYRRASRIAVGQDGVLVQGTSRRRFVPYRDLDAAEVNASGEIVLRARGRNRLRLQLVGPDTARLATIARRIQEGIDRARAQAGDRAQRFAESATGAAMSQAAHGRADYRKRAASRDDLLAIVESPASTAEARAAAVGALGGAADRAERRRLRVAAERSAEPAARALLMRIAGPASDDEEAEREAEAAAAPPLVARRG